MTQRQLADEEFEKILEGLRREPTAKLAFLNNRVIGSNYPLSGKLFGLEFYVVSPLYYRLQRHLTDWGVRSEHPHLTDLDKEGKRYFDKLYQEIRHDVLHKQ